METEQLNKEIAELRTKVSELIDMLDFVRAHRVCGEASYVTVCRDRDFWRSKFEDLANDYGAICSERDQAVRRANVLEQKLEDLKERVIAAAAGGAKTESSSTVISASGGYGGSSNKKTVAQIIQEERESRGIDE